MLALPCAGLATDTSKIASPLGSLSLARALIVTVLPGSVDASSSTALGAVLVTVTATLAVEVPP
jgi:hypothetical protein